MNANRFTWFNATTLTFGFVFLYLPILLLIVYSFNDSKLVTVWGGFSTRWYVSLFQNESFMSAAWVTLKVALLSATLATSMGTLAALVLTRAGRFRGRMLFSGMIYSPLVMPEVITGLSLLLLFVAIGLDRGFWIMPAVVAAWLLAFTLSLDDLVIASFTSGPGATTLPMKIYSQVRLGLKPEINALSTLLIVAVSVGVISASLIAKRAEKIRERANAD